MLSASAWQTPRRDRAIRGVRAVRALQGLPAPRTVRALPLLALYLFAGCADPTDPADRTFHLVAAEGPVESLLGTGVFVPDGTLELDDAVIVQTLTLRCDPASAGCQLPGGWAERTGSVGSTAVTPSGARRVTWSDAREALLTVRSDTAWVAHPTPAPTGFSTVTFRFER